MTWLTISDAWTLFAQTDYWIDRSGDEHRLADMGDSYLRNVIRFLRRGNPLSQIVDYRQVLGNPPMGEQAGYAYDDAVDEVAEWTSDVRATPLYRALVLERWRRRDIRRRLARLRS